MSDLFRVPEHYRVKDSTNPVLNLGAGTKNGFFSIPENVFKGGIPTFGGHSALIIASDGEETDWEHISISFPHRCPTWDEMCFVKELFWEPEARVVQFHPPESEYINNHPYCLHLWRHKKLAMPHPPTELVGITKKIRN